MNEAKNYTLRILNDEYVVQSDEQKDILDKAYRLVDTYMREILDKSKHMDHKKVAVLTALRLASKFIQVEDALNTIQLKEQELIKTLERMG